MHATDLRELCLKMESPSSQAIRDACADLLHSPPHPLSEGVSFMKGKKANHKFGKIYVGKGFLHKTVSRRDWFNKSTLFIATYVRSLLNRGKALAAERL